MTYLLDADVFIRAKNLHYGLDFCPAFWEWLTVKHRAGNVYSVEKSVTSCRPWPTSCQRGPRNWTTVSLCVLMRPCSPPWRP